MPNPRPRARRFLNDSVLLTLGIMRVSFPISLPQASSVFALQVNLVDKLVGQLDSTPIRPRLHHRVHVARSFSDQTQLCSSASLPLTNNARDDYSGRKLKRSHKAAIFTCQSTIFCKLRLSRRFKLPEVLSELSFSRQATDVRTAFCCNENRHKKLEIHLGQHNEYSQSLSSFVGS